VTSHYTLPGTGGSVHFSPGRGWSLPAQNFSRFSAIIRVLDTGIGSVRFVLEFNDADLFRLSTRGLIELADLSPSIAASDLRCEEHPEIDVLGGRIRLNELFRLEVETLARALGTTWIDVCGIPGPVIVNPPLIATDTYDYQCPFVISLIRGYVPRKASLAALARPVNHGQSLHEATLCKQIAGLLVRLRDWEQINERYAEKNVDAFDSIFPSREVYLNIHARSALCISEASAAPASHVFDLGDVLIESVVDTIELLRTRWHGLIISSFVLSETMKDVYRLVTDPQRPVGWLTAPAEWTKLVTRIILTQRHCSELLENAVSYRRAAGAFIELYERGMERFGITELADEVTGKLKSLDRVYDYAFELQRLGSVAELRSKRLLGVPDVAPDS
jgi:hypothetical protein